MAARDAKRVNSVMAEDECRKALRAVINAKFNRDIAGSQWSTVVPSDPRNEGGLNCKASAWRKTIRRSVELLRDAKYEMNDPTQDDIDDVLDDVLNLSVRLLYKSIKTIRPKGDDTNFARKLL